MLDTLFFIIAIADGLLVGYCFASLCKLLFGDNPLGRLLKLIISIGTGVGYSIWVFIANDSTEGSMIGFLILTFAPIVIFLVLAIIGYMFDGKSDK